MMVRRNKLSPVAAACWILALLASSCAKDGPVSPGERSGLARVQVGVLGNVPARVEPRHELQLWALAAGSDGGTTDVTNLAQWSSSNAAVASVGPGGLVSGVSEGRVVVKATYQSVTGQLDTEVTLVVGCSTSTLAPTSFVFGTNGWTRCSDDGGQYGQRVDVVASSQACTWTATSDVPWLGMDCYSRAQTYTPSQSGSGSFFYRVDPNNTPSSRIGHITVSFQDGARIVHTVSEEAPTCSFTTSPLETTVPKEGGSASFDVVAVPSDCRWTISGLPNYQVAPPLVALSRTSGTGSQRVDYRVVSANVGPTTGTRHLVIYINGLSGVNPPGTHTVVQPAQ
jgi:Big-like domain-containing protein